MTKNKRKEKKIIELKFNEKKEKVIILMKNANLEIYDRVLQLVESQSDKKVLLLPSEYIEEIKIIKIK